MNEQKNNKLFRNISRLQPSYIVITAIILIIALLTSGLIELSHTKREIYNLMEEEAATLHQALQLSATNAIISFDEIEYLIGEKLLSVARQVDQLDRLKIISQIDLKRIAEQNQIFRINIFDPVGNKFLSSHEDMLMEKFSSQSAYNKYILPLQEEDVDELVLGIVESRHENEKRFAVAINRAKGGVIVTNIDASEILSFRKTIGVGKLMQDVGQYENFSYIVLQDEMGIILATENVTRMNSLNSDQFLLDAFSQRKSASRYFTYNDKTVLEFVGPFIMNEEPIGLFRLGLVTDHLMEASQRLKRRLIIMSLVVGAFILIMINLLIINQNYRLIRSSYQRIKTYTGNILEHMADAVLALNKKEDITIFNKSAMRLFKVQPDELLKKETSEMISNKIPSLLEALNSGKIVQELEETIDVNGDRSIISINTSILKNENDDIDSAFAVIKDLTEKRQLEEAIKRKEKLTAMGQLASGVAHEIRNPLNAIGLVSQRLNREFEPNRDKEEYIQLTKTMVSEVRRINEIIQQFLNLARPPRLNRKPIQLNNILKSINTLISSQAKEKNISISEIYDDLPSMNLDENQIHQALLNIIQNGIEAMNDSGKLIVRTGLNAREVYIAISDTGSGMDDGQLSKIFNLYYTTKSNGTGLGLSIAHQIISQHDGRIIVESEVGEGTRFTIYLPFK